jgi:hypothetical protein
MLVRRWGVLWRPLEIKFRRRAAVITACVRLHNFCIDKRIETHMREKNGLTELQPDRWSIAPKLDRDGRPLRMLQTKRGPPDSDAPAPPGDRYSRRQELIEAIFEAGLKRPKSSNVPGRR